LKNEYLRKVREMTTARRTARKPEVVPEFEQYKARSFFSLMQHCDQAAQPSSASA
jgi:hypothetical protein